MIYSYFRLATVSSLLDDVKVGQTSEYLPSSNQMTCIYFRPCRLANTVQYSISYQIISWQHSTDHIIGISLAQISEYLGKTK
jgi:hypothetical protein